jgi:hypothetical protein
MTASEEINTLLRKAQDTILEAQSKIVFVSNTDELEEIRQESKRLETAWWDCKFDFHGRGNAISDDYWSPSSFEC